MGTFRIGARPGEFVLAFFGEASSERVVGVCPDFGVSGGLFDFGADELVFEIVLVILVFAIGQLAVDQVAQCVVGVFDAVVFFKAVAAADVVAFALSFCRFVGKDVVGGVEGEGFAAAALAVAGFLNASDFVVNVIKDAASLVGALNQVAGFVVGVAAVDGAAGQRVLFASGCLCTAPNGTLAFQTTHGVVVVQAADAALRPLDFAVQFVAFDVTDDFAVEADLVQVSAAVVQVIDMAAVGQDGADAVAQRVVSVAYGGALAVVDGGFADEAVAFYDNAAVVVAFAVAALSVGIDAVDKFAVFVETVHFRPPQCVGNDGMVFSVVERPFFAEVVAAFKHFAVGVAAVVFVAGHQSVGLAVFDHDVVAVDETAQLFAVASVNGGQIAIAVVVVAYQFLAVEGDGGEAVDVETFVFGNEDVPFSGRVKVGIVVVQTDGGKYGLEVSAAAVVNAVRQSVVVVAEADMAAVAVELGDQLENAAAGIDFGKQQPCASVGGGDLIEAV